jgi:hypothetical protein
MQQFFYKTYHIKNVAFQIHSNKSYMKKVSELFVIDLRRNLEFLGSNCIIKY